MTFAVSCSSAVVGASIRKLEGCRVANPEHVRMLREFVNDPKFTWARVERIGLDLTGADLRGIDLKQMHVLNSDFSGADLDDVVMAYSEFHSCKFVGASLRGAHLGSSLYIACTFENAQLAGANLASGRFSGTNFTRANMQNANGVWANFRSSIFDQADLRGVFFQSAELPFVSFRTANLEGAEFLRTVLTAVDFTGARGLDRVRHSAHSLIDFETVQRSGGLPLAFLRGCGLADEVIDFYQSAQGAIHFYSCFISHADADRNFADRLYADLQSRGVRCWYSPEHLKIGAPQRATFNEAIHVHDKLLLVLSRSALASAWVESEVETALERERKEKRRIMFPVRLDDDVLETSLAWAAEVRTRHIGNFGEWRNHDAYQQALERLLRDLKAPEVAPTGLTSP